jgi:hypothetical protein
MKKGLFLTTLIASVIIGSQIQAAQPLKQFPPQPETDVNKLIVRFVVVNKAFNKANISKNINDVDNALMRVDEFLAIANKIKTKYGVSQLNARLKKNNGIEFQDLVNTANNARIGLEQLLNAALETESGIAKADIPNENLTPMVNDLDDLLLKEFNIKKF